MAVVGLIFRIIGWVLLSLILLIIILLHFSAVVRVHIAADGLRWNVKYMGFTLAPRKKREKKSKKTDSEDSPSEVYDEIDEEIAALDLEDDDLEKDIEALEPEPEKSETAEADKQEPEKTASEEKSEDKKKLKDKKGKKDKLEKKKSGKSDSKQEGGLRGKINGLKKKYEFIKPYIPFTWKMFKRLLKIIRIRIDDVRLTVGREDAHEAAIFYGQTQAAVSNLLTMLGGMFTVKVKKCDINCRFAENHFDGSADVSVRLRPSTAVWIVLLIAFNAAGIFIKQKLAARKAKKAAARA